jgi:uncharacterized protein (DUF3820 family)
MTWGKYRAKSIKWIFENDQGYIAWLIKNEFVANNCSRLKKELLQLVASEGGKQ